MSVVCLHIGLPKTGSSAIQSFLETFADSLRRRGLYYAQNEHTRSDSAIASSGNGRALVKYLDPRRRRADFDEAQFERVLQKIYFSERQRVSVISSELLAAVHWPQLEAFRDRVLDGRPVMVVAVIRNIYDHALSSWNQAVKWHAYTETFEHYAREAYQNPQISSLRKYARHFGWDAIRLIRYEEHRDDLAGGFLEAVGVEGKAGWTAPRTNRSLTQAELTIQLALNRLHEDSFLAKETAERFLARRPDAPAAPLWRPEIVQLLADRFGEEVERLGKMTGQDLQSLLTPRARAPRIASPLDYARAMRAALPVATKVLRARFSAAAAATAPIPAE